MRQHARATRLLARMGSDDERRLRNSPPRSAVPRDCPDRASTTNQLRQVLQPTYGQVLRV